MKYNCICASMFFNQYKLRVHSLFTIIEYIVMKKMALNTKDESEKYTWETKNVYRIWIGKCNKLI